ncbi:hypothetical protein [Photobacterium profundum]|uniref:hypothetical protein n=1 Tax=Photobacterium profundum TaxID=74109 RepID=UPI003D0E68AE
MNAKLSCISFFLLIIMLGCDSSGNEGTIISDEKCQSFKLNISPLTLATTFACGSIGEDTIKIMSDLNSFWGSSVKACSCLLDAMSGGCLNNAFVLNSDIGYIYFDAGFQNEMDLVVGNKSASDWLMGHEFGHNIQINMSLITFGKQKELQADCLSGYFFGYRECQGEIKENDIVAAMQGACSAGDSFISGWWDNTHGTCQERVSATMQGLDGYRLGFLPSEACP